MNTDKIRKAIEVAQLAAAATMTLMQLVVVLREGAGGTGKIGFSNRNDCQESGDLMVIRE